MPTTKRDLQALAYLAKRLREETPGAREWQDPGLWAVLAKLEGHNLHLTIERVIRHAADPDARTPAAIERAWIPDAPKAETRYPAKAGGEDECRRHPGEHTVGCRACAADQKAGEPGPTVINRQPSTPPTPAYLAARGIRQTEETEA